MSKLIDLKGLRFGRWAVLARAERLGYWSCRCDCGATKAVHGGSLRGGKSRSCGCLIADVSAATKIVDMAGVRVGKLVAVRRAENDGKAVRWECLCDCGGVSVVRAVNLRSGNTNSCGCARLKREIVAPDSVRLARRERSAARYRNDPAYQIRIRMANAIRISLRRRSSRKIGRWEELVGYTASDLRAHLVSTLPAGATWQDFMDGRLEIDHKVPLAAFNYQHAGDLDFRRAWAMSNLQLLWTADNQSKSDKLDEPFQPSLGF